MKHLIGQRIMIFGGTGSLGKTLVRRFIDRNKIIVFSRDEAKQWTLRNQWKGKAPDWKLNFEIGDMRDKDRVLKAIIKWQPDTIIIASALKQVPVCELDPHESIKTNVMGVQNVVDAIELARLEEPATVLMVSTDKACSPINVYGMCKSIAERIVIERSRHETKHKYVAVRYGNVLESRASIIPLFKWQAANADKLTLTHEDMTRFVMTLDQSVDLIVDAIEEAEPGETWIPKLPSMNIRDLAGIFSDMSGKPIAIIGMRPGEKLDEALINESESFRVREVKGTTYYAIQSQFGSYTHREDPFEYTSKDPESLMSKDQLRKFLGDLGIFDLPLEHFEGKSIEEIPT